MGCLSKEEKNALKKEWKAVQCKDYILTEENVQELFKYLQEELDKAGCDHTLYHTERWLSNNISKELIASVVTELADMGGYCDCEVLLNCYEDYEID